MTRSKRWTVDIFIDEHDESRSTRAEARLRTQDVTDLRGVGTATRNPHDVEVPEIGDELAASRALADLAAALRGAATSDIEEVSDRASHGW